ncbi:uncharacterized protein B0H64DRAFT_472144 [Chaetomium fimeti]|uniref:FAD/NAD(P)-binding domain-containing protein n=1 Tax=Chaetomium fimeti TaxID=1854472 RepID=A0AAE0HNM7_9PEZI|nr:hypothetical protein B0H64DRAFT_472144 [Chaetomium fimeti]
MQPLTRRRCCSHLRGGALSIFRSALRQSLKPSSPNTFYSPLPFWLVRRNHNVTNAVNAPQNSQNADAIVVGGGAAGIAVVGNLLEVMPQGRIVWIDRSFMGGSIGQLYREVPSYSPAGDFLQYAQALKLFRDICDAAPKPNVMTTLQSLDPEMTCPLHHAADMLTFISDNLIQHPRVEPVLGTVTHSVRDPKARQWTITLTPNHDIGTITPDPQQQQQDLSQQQQQQQHQHQHLHQHLQHPPHSQHHPQKYKHTAPLLIYCTGTRPKTTDLPLPLSRLTLDTCLSPTRLSRLLAADRPRTVAVIGSGHAAVLVLRGLVGLVEAGSHPLLRVRWFVRDGIGRGMGGGFGGIGGVGMGGGGGEAVRFAQEMLEGGWLAEEGGQLAEEGERRAEEGAGRFITRLVIPPMEAGHRAMKKGLEGVDYVVEDAGFVRGRLPEVRPGLGVLQGPVGKPKNLVFNAPTGSFYPNGGSRDHVLGLFGAGSAFPDVDRSVAGWGQPAIGVWEFMKSVQRMVPRWVQVSKTRHVVKRDDRDWGGRGKKFRESRYF